MEARPARVEAFLADVLALKVETTVADLRSNSGSFGDVGADALRLVLGEQARR